MEEAHQACKRLVRAQLSSSPPAAQPKKDDGNFNPFYCRQSPRQDEFWKQWCGTQNLQNEDRKGKPPRLIFLQLPSRACTTTEESIGKPSSHWQR